MGKRISFDNARINALATDPGMKARFPFLGKSIERQCCGGRRRFCPDYESIKAHVASMSGEDLQQFKDAIGASELVVYIKGTAGPQEIVK